MKPLKLLLSVLFTRFSLPLWGVLLLLAGIAGFVCVTNSQVHPDVDFFKNSRRGPRAGAFLASTDLSSWKNEIAKCARPGPNVRRFVNRFPGKPPERMAQVYQFIVEKWHYEADGDRDWLTPAEDLFGDPEHVVADCKAVAIALAASARELHIDAEMVATKGRGIQPGHVQTRILLSDPEEDPNPMISRMLTIWAAQEANPRELPLIQTEGRTYFVLDGGLPPRLISNLGPVEAVITN
jgi:hypothetical protein